MTTGGHVVARIDEARSLTLQGVNWRRPITVAEHIAETAQFVGPVATTTYIANWRRVDVSCAGIESALSAVKSELVRQLGSTDVSEEIIRTAFDPIYRDLPTRTARRDDSSPIGAAPSPPVVTPPAVPPLTAPSTPLAPSDDRPRRRRRDR